jgi:hypothetical protein
MIVIFGEVIPQAVSSKGLVGRGVADERYA